MAVQIYRASRLDEIKEPPAGEEFDPYRDTVYSELMTGSFQSAIEYAKADYHECGRVEQIQKRGRTGITTIITAWEVYPDGTTRSIEP